jgi:hypothetical protein
MTRNSNFRLGRLTIGFVACIVLALSCAESSAQYYYAPATTFFPAPAPVAVYATPRRVTSYYAPAYGSTFVAGPTVGPVYSSPYTQTTYMSPAPYASTYQTFSTPIPVTSYYGPTYSSFYAPAPAVVATGVPVYAGPTAVVRSKVYYPGQPIRNTLRAVTP